MIEAEPANDQPPRRERVRLRLENLEDAAFLFDLFSSTRAQELSATGWDDSTLKSFLQMQFSTQTQSYRRMFPFADFYILTQDNRSIGRVILNRTEQDIRIIDLALLPDFRGQQIGTRFMQELLAEAAHTGKCVRLQALKGGRACHWYERLGFRNHGGTGLHEEMEWHPMEKRQMVRSSQTRLTS
jgi:GNAT superfamily N-acetyltransferase